MVVEFLFLAIGAYLLGSIPTAYLVGKWTRGIDIRQYGSGNVGAANVLTTVSKRWSIPVTLFDIAKGALPVLMARWLGFSPGLQLVIGLFAIAGHNWTPFLHFRGGRGIFTSLGVILMISWKLGLIMLVLPYLFAPIKQLSLGVFFALLALPFLSWFLSGPLGVEDKLAVTFGFIALTLIAYIRRLANPKKEVSQTVPTPEILLNRLLFDRDIRDRKLWISQNLSRQNQS